MFVCCQCCGSSGRYLCDGLIILPEKSYKCGLPECDREGSIMRKPWHIKGCCAMENDVCFSRIN